MEPGKSDLILDSATTVFAQKGYEYASISDIAKEAGISTGLVYSYFQNKLDVLLSIILIFLKEINQLNKERLSVLRDPFDKLYTFLHNFEDLLLKNDKALCRVKVLHDALPHIVMLKGEKLAKKKDLIMQENRVMITTIDEIMESGQKAGVFEDTLKPAVLRQAFAGCLERVIYGLFFKTFSGQEIGYERDDAHEALVKIIEKFIRK